MKQHGEVPNSWVALPASTPRLESAVSQTLLGYIAASLRYVANKN
jgi:hypothetical protein